MIPVVRLMLLAVMWFRCVIAVGSEAVDTVVTKLPARYTVSAQSGDGLDIPEQTLTLSERDGWLVVTLTAEDELEWTIILAKLAPNRMPVITHRATLPFISVQYGPYFARESVGRLRVYRERKSQDDIQVTSIEPVPQGKLLCHGGRLQLVETGDWCWLSTSPVRDRRGIDTLIRFQHVKLKHGHGATVFADRNLAEVFCGNAHGQDEGDLLVASRIAGYHASALISAMNTKNSLIGNFVPPIEGTSIGPVGTPTSDEMRGKVILVDFWAMWCGPCVEKLPEVVRLQEKYRDRGFIVIGVHSSQGSERAAEFLAQNAGSFAVVTDDDGKTERRFAVSQYPAYFLIGRDGLVKSSLGSTCPTESQIEAELGMQ
jgi:thiol-disulfide isomerase/thioredoxin